MVMERPTLILNIFRNMIIITILIMNIVMIYAYEYDYACEHGGYISETSYEYDYEHYVNKYIIEPEED